jgi:hypothetical protein
MHLLKQLPSLLAIALPLAATAAFAQTLPTIPIDPKVLPTFPETSVSNVPPPERVQLVNNLAGVVEPVPISPPLSAYSSQCKGFQESGSVTLAFIVDANGNPRNVMFKNVLENQLDLLALKILLLSRFTPATIDGTPTAFGQDVDIHLDVCTEKQPGSTAEVTRLRSAATQKFVPWRKAPAEANLAPLKMPTDAIADAENVKDGGLVPPIRIPQHRAFDTRGMTGSFAFGVLVDEHGIGHIQKVLRSTNPPLLPIVSVMIESMRRIPAMKNGMPVPVHVIEGLTLQH